MAHDPDAPPIYELEDVWKSFDGRPVLKGIDLKIPTGQTLVVMGPSGCGKSVMLKHLVGLLKPDQGQIRFHGEAIEDFDERRLVPIRRRIGFLFQQAALFDSLNVRENLAFPLLETGQAGPNLDQRIRECLARVGLEDTMEQMPSELSGGMRKRVGLARAIARGGPVNVCMANRGVDGGITLAGSRASLREQLVKRARESSPDFEEWVRGKRPRPTKNFRKSCKTIQVTLTLTLTPTPTPTLTLT